MTETSTYQEFAAALSAAPPAPPAFQGRQFLLERHVTPLSFEIAAAAEMTHFAAWYFPWAFAGRFSGSVDLQGVRSALAQKFPVLWRTGLNVEGFAALVEGKWPDLFGWWSMRGVGGGCAVALPVFVFGSAVVAPIEPEKAAVVESRGDDWSEEAEAELVKWCNEYFK